MRFGTFFLPGPTEVRREVLEAMLQPMIAHRGPVFAELFAKVQTGLKTVFQTTRPVFISASSAVGFMESAVRCAPSGPILSLVNGAFSDRFARIAEACGKEVDRYEVAWGDVHDPGKLNDYLARRSYTSLTVVHSETSTGVLNPLQEIAQVAQQHGVFCLADSVSGIGGAEVQTDAWDLDFVLTASQKALALPPGLAFAAVSDRYLELAATQTGKGVYFDVTEFASFHARGQVPNTPALSLYYSLARQLDDIERETMPSRWVRHTELAAITMNWVDKLRDTIDPHFHPLAAEGAGSPTVTTVVLPPRLPGLRVVEEVARHGFTIGAGYGKLKDTTIRIGHMGDHTADRLQLCLDVCEDVLREMLS